MNACVDLNADLGEGADGEAQLLELVSSANIATGGHAGDEASIALAIRAARQKGVAVGAHPSFPDRENFGRREMEVLPGGLRKVLAEQLKLFLVIAAAERAKVRHVKPHGALYNMAARDAAVARLVVETVMTVDRSLFLFAPARSELETAAESAGLQVVREVFADRNYMPDGSLVPRSRSDALLHNPTEAGARVLRMLREGVVEAIDGSRLRIQVETICVHGDTPGAVMFAQQLRQRLEDAGIRILAPCPGAGAPPSVQRRFRPEGGPAQTGRLFN